MAYDEGVAERARELLADQPALAERQMFGGLSFMVQGNFCRGVVNDDLVVRVGPEAGKAALIRPHARWISPAAP